MLFLSLVYVVCIVHIAFCQQQTFNPIKVNESFLKSPELTDETFIEMKAGVKNDEEYFLFFYTEWCPACQDFKAAFNLFLENEYFKKNGINAFRINAEKNPELSARFFLVSLPTLVHIKYGQVRTISHLRWKLVDYFDEQQWGTVPAWGKFKDPFGMPATAFGTVTRMGHFVAMRAKELKWPKWKWISVFFVCVLLAWTPVIYLGLVSRERSANTFANAADDNTEDTQDHDKKKSE